MRFISILALLFSILISTNSFAQVPDDFDNSSDRETSQILAFVGKKIFLRYALIDREPTIDENGEEQIIISLDSRFEARYEILHLVSGDYDGDQIDFVAFDHYGEPAFSDHESILIFVHDTPEGRFHDKYNFYDVEPTSDGDWASCGDTFTQSDENLAANEKEPLEPISFLEPWAEDVPSLFQKVDDVLAEYYDCLLYTSDAADE